MMAHRTQDQQTDLQPNPKLLDLCRRRGSQTVTTAYYGYRPANGSSQVCASYLHTFSMFIHSPIFLCFFTNIGIVSIYFEMLPKPEIILAVLNWLSSAVPPIIGLLTDQTPFNLLLHGWTRPLKISLWRNSCVTSILSFSLQFVSMPLNGVSCSTKTRSVFVKITRPKFLKIWMFHNGLQFGKDTKARFCFLFFLSIFCSITDY